MKTVLFRQNDIVHDKTIRISATEKDFQYFKINIYLFVIFESAVSITRTQTGALSL